MSEVNDSYENNNFFSGTCDKCYLLEEELIKSLKSVLIFI